MHCQATMNLYGMLTKMGKICQRNDLEGEKMGTLYLLGLLIQEQKENGRIRMTDISQRMMVSKPAATQMVERLVEKGYVERVRDENDRRVVYIQPSPAGEKAFNVELDIKLSAIDRAIKRMGEENANQLMDLLDMFFVAAGAPEE